jgi:uncharacterized protein YbjT (DUF2867 family)
MSTVVVLGATGGVGSRVAARLVQRGDRVIGLHRRPEQARALLDHRIEAVMGDLTSITPAALASKLQGADAVVFTAGAPDAGTEAADAVDGRGVEIAVTAARAAGVQRFLLVSAFPDAWRDRRMPEEFEHYMKVKRQADVHLAESPLDWVILRPGTLTNGPGTGHVRLGPVIPYGEVSRDDVAAVFAELVHAPTVRRSVLELTRGAVPVSEAVMRLRV